MNTLFPPLTPDAAAGLERLQACVDEALPLPPRYRRGIEREVAELSALLTSARGQRERDYLSRPGRLAAYLRYYLPWNAYRLCRLLPALPLDLRPGDAVVDLGAGPLTFTIALWLSRPETRALPLEFRCVDRSGAALEAGRKLFAALTAAVPGPAPGAAPGAPSPWRIRAVRDSLSAEIRGGGAALVTAVNVYNELFWDLSPEDSRGLAALAKHSARRLASLCAGTGAGGRGGRVGEGAAGDSLGRGSRGGCVLIVEPGIPRSGEFLTALRSALLDGPAAAHLVPLAPCVHCGPCPMPGGMERLAPGRRAKRKWCHFTFDTAGAPPALRRLSEEAGLPKERGALSFLFMGPPAPAPAVPAPGAVPAFGAVRLISDPFPLPSGDWGRYGCAVSGLVLAAGDKMSAARLPSGSLLAGGGGSGGRRGSGEQGTGNRGTEPERDPKTGAVIIRVGDRGRRGSGEQGAGNRGTEPERDQETRRGSRTSIKVDKRLTRGPGRGSRVQGTGNRGRVTGRTEPERDRANPRPSIKVDDNPAKGRRPGARDRAPGKPGRRRHQH